MQSLRAAALALLATTACLLVVAGAAASEDNSVDLRSNLNLLQHASPELYAAVTNLDKFVGQQALRTRLPHAVRPSSTPPVGCDEERGDTTVLECEAAKKQFQDVVSSCHVPDLANGFVNPLSVTSDEVKQYCFEGCNTQVQSELARLVRSCWNGGDFNPSAVANFQEALVVSSALCLFVGDDEVCLTAFQNISRVADSLKTGSLKKKQIQQLCNTPCVDDQYRLLQYFGQGRYLGATGFYKLFCSQYDGEYCALEYQDGAKKYERNPNKSNTRKAICTPCYRRFVESANKTLTLAGGSVGAFSTSDFDAQSDELTYFCDADRHGKFCTDIVEKKAKKAGDLSACADLFTLSASSCSSTCAQQLRDQLALTGCCTLTLLKEKLNNTLSGGSNPRIEEVYNRIRTQCNVALPNSCAAQVVNFQLGLSNVNDEFINQPNAKVNFGEALHRDLAAQLGVPFDNVVITSIEFVPASGIQGEIVCIDGERRVRSGVKVKGYVIPVSGEGVSKLYTQFNDIVTNNLLELAETATILPLTLEGRTDVLSPFERNFQIGSSVTLAANPNA